MKSSIRFTLRDQDGRCQLERRTGSQLDRRGFLRRVQVPFGGARGTAGGVRSQVEPSGIDEDPMHGDVGIAKLGELWSYVGCVASRDGHDHVGGSRAVDELLESIDASQDGNRVGLGMERQMTAAGPQAGGSRDDAHRRTRRKAGRSTACRRGCERAAGHRAGHRPGRPGFRPDIAGLAAKSSRSSMNRRRSLGDDTAPGTCVRRGPDSLVGGRTILGRPRSRRILFKLFDRPVRR